jgi:hypothetical protein
MCCATVLLFFVLCTLCWQFLWIVHFWLACRYSLMYIDRQIYCLHPQRYFWINRPNLNLLRVLFLKNVIDIFNILNCVTLSYAHCWKHYQEDVYWYELCSLLKALTEGCILVWVILIVESFIRRMHTGMSYTHCWRYYEEDVYWYEFYPLLKVLSGGCIFILVYILLLMPSTMNIAHSSIYPPVNVFNNEHNSHHYTSSW